MAHQSLVVCLLIWLTFGLVACAVVEKQVVKDTEEVVINAVKSVLEKLTPFFKKAVVVTVKTLNRQWVLWRAKSEQRVVLQSIEMIRPGMRWRVAPARVKVFVEAFVEGARDPESHFADPLIDRELLARWMATPKKNRVFIIGAQPDTPFIESLRARLEDEKKTVFFYQFCSGVLGKLCESSTVGAFFGTAGTAVLAMSEHSESSPFVPLEVKTGIRLATHQNPLYIVSPDETIKALTKAVEVRTVQATIDSESDSR
jgi:hypothetical protein